MSCGVGHRCGSAPELVWLRCRPAAIALMQPLSWEPPYAASVALKSKKQNKANKKRRSLDFELESQTQGKLAPPGALKIKRFKLLNSPGQETEALRGENTASDQW